MSRRRIAVALTSLMTERAFGSVLQPATPRGGHYPAKASSVIFLFMDGGPSQVDTFDPKPRLTREHGQPIRMAHPPTQFIPHAATPEEILAGLGLDATGIASAALALLQTA